MLVLRWKGSTNGSLSHATELCLSGCCCKMKDWEEMKWGSGVGRRGCAWASLSFQSFAVHLCILRQWRRDPHVALCVPCPAGRKQLEVNWWVSVVFLNVFGVLDFPDDSNVSISASDSPQLLNWQKDSQPGLDLTPSQRILKYGLGMHQLSFQC